MPYGCCINRSMERRNGCQARSGGIELKRLKSTNREKEYYRVVTRFLSWSLFCAFVIMAGCGKLKLKEDHYKCDPAGGTGACPAGWTCLERAPGSDDFRCFRSVGNGGFSDASVDGAVPVCGNNIKEEGEECDGTDLGDETCESLGLGGGNLGCTASCTFDTNGCDIQPECGNDVKEPGEVCDGEDLGGETCESQGFLGGGELACLDDCSGFDVLNCIFDECGDGWVLIPVGEFQMGCNSSGEPCSAGGSTNESPRHTVTLSAYCIQLTQVSVAQYRECRHSGHCTGPPRDTDSDDHCNWTATPKDREDHPINCVNWADSRQYCQWVGGDLPTEAQWEKAARGGKDDQRTYPWGDAPQPNCESCNCSFCGDPPQPPGTWPVGYIAGTAGDSPYGLKDMCGNVWEWTLDCYEENFYATCGEDCVNPVNKIEGCTGSRVLRGGSYANDNNPSQYRVVYRNHQNNPQDRYSTYGFRCVRPRAE